MKKIWILLIMVMLLAFPASALTVSSHVTDEAGLLSDMETEILEQRARSISRENPCEIYIVTVHDYRQDTSGSIEDYAEELYLENDLGRGEEQDGLLLVLSMAERDYSLTSHGSFANTQFVNARKDQIIDGFLDDFRDNNWFDGFADYLDASERMLHQEVLEEVEEFSTGKLLIVLLVPLAVAGVVCGVFYSQMKSARPGHDADAYSSGIDLTLRQDFFTHRTVRREKIERNTTSSGGSRSSSGFSSRSGKF